jgi:hypothetical protein
MDNLINCNRCSSDACYVQEVNENIKTYICYGCGFASNSLMKEGEEFYEQQISLLPELYKDLLFKDDDGKVWFPSTVNIPSQGMIFANGNNIRNWKWAAVKSVHVTESEQSKYPIPGKPEQFYKHRMDMTTMQEFDERDYMDALSYIGVLPE